jgi:hypothetical protein
LGNRYTLHAWPAARSRTLSPTLAYAPGVADHPGRTATSFPLGVAADRVLHGDRGGASGGTRGSLFRDSVRQHGRPGAIGQHARRGPGRSGPPWRRTRRRSTPA